MNNLLAPPTDNLYKFMAIGGLWLTLGTIAFFTYLGYLNYKSKIETQEYLGYMRSVIVVKDVNKRIDLLNTGKATKENQLEWLPQPLPKENELLLLKEILKNNQDGIKNYRNIPRLYSEKLNEVLAIPIWFLISIMSIGTFLMLFGFLLWYKKLQSGQDKLAELELALKKLLLSETEIEVKLKSAQLEKTKLEIKQLSKPRYPNRI